MSLAALLGGWSLGFGLPWALRPDEDVMVGRAVRMALEPTLDPRFYAYPPLAFDLFAAAVRLAGWLPGVPIGAATGVDPSGEILADRMLSTAAFAGSAAFTYLLARRELGGSAALLAAGALAVAPLAVREAHFATTDMPELFFVCLALWAAMRATGGRGFLGAGAAAGLAFECKYPGGAAIAAILVTALWGVGAGDGLRRLAAAGLGFAVVAIVLTVATGHIGDYAGGIRFLSGRAAAFSSMPPGWLYHATQSLPYGLGLGTFAVAMAGIAVALRRRTRLDAALICFIALSYAPIGASHEDFFRYAMPLLPALCVLAAGTLRILPTRPGRLCQLVLGALLVPSLWNSIQFDRLLGQTDTRVEAARWLLARPAGAAVLISDYWSQPLYASSELGRRSLHPFYATGDRRADSFQMGRFTDHLVVNQGEPDGTANDRPCYRVLASAAPWQTAVSSDRPLAVFSPGSPGEAVYDRIDSFYLPVWGFSGLDRSGPWMAIEECDRRTTESR